MQWKYNPPESKNSIQPNTKRTVTKFAFFPSLVGDRWVWLECYKSYQIYKWRTWTPFEGNVYSWEEQSRSLM